MSSKDIINYSSVVLLLLFATIIPVQNFIARALGFSDTSIVFNLLYAGVLVSIYVLIKLFILKDDASKEKFFFEVSNPNKCSGLYEGKPTSFQYSMVGSGDCKPISNPPLGMIADVKSCIGGNNFPQNSTDINNKGWVPSISLDEQVQPIAPQSIVYPYRDVRKILNGN